DAGAQEPVDPSGHWEGSIQIPAVQGRSAQDLRFEIDIARTDASFRGAISMPAQKLKGLPLLLVSVNGSTVKFHARRDQTFAGTLAPDGQTMTGEFTMLDGTVPFTLRRFGNARIDAPLRSPRIDKDLEGTWSGSVKAKDKTM